MGLPLAGTHRPGSLHLFFTKLFSKFATAQWADRVVGPYKKVFRCSVPCRGGRLCPPAEYTDFTRILGKSVTSQRADVGIGPYNRIRRCIRIRRGFPITPCIPPGGAEPRPYQVLCEVVLLCGF